MTAVPPASDADRDRLIGLLGEHYARGDIDEAELDRRTGIVLTARLLEDAAAALVDLPALTVRAAGGLAGNKPDPENSPGSARRPGQRKRHGHAAKPAPGWLPTGELFRDPSSGLVTRVWVDPADSSRHYIPEP